MKQDYIDYIDYETRFSLSGVHILTYKQIKFESTESLPPEKLKATCQEYDKRNSM